METITSSPVRTTASTSRPHFRATPSYIVAAALWLAFVLCPGPGRGAEGDALWGNITVSDRPGSFQLISDGAGGTFIAFAEDRSYPSYAGPVYLVRLDQAGTVLWGPLQLTPSGATANRPRLCSDGGGGVYVAWAQDIASGGSQVYVQRVNSGGSIYWSNPYPGSNPSSIDSLAVAAGSQGMFLVYRTDVALFAAHINASGVLAAPGIGGFSLGTARTFGAQPCVVPDGSGGNGVIVAWSDVYKNIQVQNVVLSAVTMQ